MNVLVLPSHHDSLLTGLFLQLGQGASTPSRELINYVVQNPDRINDTAEVLSFPAQTLLHRAAYLGRMVVAAWLVMKGANINAVDGNGETPLDHATAQDHKELADYLRSKGAFLSGDRLVDNLGQAGAGKSKTVGAFLAGDRFVDNLDGTVTDTRSGLTWMRCALGQTWDGKHCTGIAKCLSWGQALALNHTFAGHNNWRMPSIDELLSLVAIASTYRNTYMSIFPNAPNAPHWSSSPNTTDSGLIQCMQLPKGGIKNIGKNYDSGVRVRLVRGGKTLTSSASPMGADTNFEISKSIEIPQMVANSQKIMSFGSISNSNGTSTNEKKVATTPESILSNPKSPVPKFAYEQNAGPMVSVTAKHRDMDTATQSSSQHGKPNGADTSPPVEVILERLDLLEYKFDLVIKRIEGVLAPISTDQSKTLDVINQLPLRPNPSIEKLGEEFLQLRQLIDRMESRFDASINRIEADLKSLLQGQAKVMEAISLLHQRSASGPDRFISELAELRQMFLAALQPTHVPARHTTQLSAIPEPEDSAVGSISTFSAWLVEQDTIPLVELRIRLLPLDLLPAAVIDDINERALDLTGELALIEEGDNVIVQREVLLQVITN